MKFAFNFFLFAIRFQKQKIPSNKRLNTWDHFQIDHKSRRLKQIKNHINKKRFATYIGILIMHLGAFRKKASAYKVLHPILHQTN